MIDDIKVLYSLVTTIDFKIFNCKNDSLESNDDKLYVAALRHTKQKAQTLIESIANLEKDILECPTSIRTVANDLKSYAHFFVDILPKYPKAIPENLYELNNKLKALNKEGVCLQ